MSDESDDRVVGECVAGDEACPGVLRPLDERCEHFVCGRDGTALWPEPEGVDVPVDRDVFGRPTERVRARSFEAAVQWDDRLWRPIGRR